MGTIILLQDLLEQHKRKQQELEFYQTELENLKAKMFYIRKEIDLTSKIIEMIEKEMVIDILKPDK